MPVFNNILAGAAGSGGAFEGPIKSVRFNSADSAYLNRTPSSTGNRKTWTWAGWVKRSESANQALFSCHSASSDVGFAEIDFLGDTLRVSGWTVIWRNTAQVFRDFSAWYHIVVAFDTTQATAADRIKIYVNGTQITDFTTSNDPTLNGDYGINQAAEHNIGRYNIFGAGNDYLSASLADVYFIDGQALGATSFGAFDANGVWQAAAYSGSFGTNGFHLFDFANESGIGDDSSGNDNDFTVNNISSTAGAGNDVLFDVPTNGTQSDTGAGGEVSGNYATLNPLFTGSAVTLLDGNLQHDGSASIWDPTTMSRSAFGMATGKWYWEASLNTDQYSYVGIAQINKNHDYLGSDNNTCGYYTSNGLFYGGGAQTANPVVTYTANATLMFAYDADAKKFWVGQNGTWFSVGGNAGDPANGNNPSFTGFGSNGEVYTPAISTYGTVTAKFNFGARPYAYTAPSGYKALCTTNLPTPTIADGSDYFDTKLWTGNGSTQTISGLEFSPDLVWIKSRSGAYSHLLFDQIRGTTKYLRSDNTGAEGTDSNSLTAFTSDGFSVGTTDAVNQSNGSLVAWAWDAGSSTVSNTDGTITSSVRANQTAGFSIVSYTGSGSSGTVGHGLNAVPEMIILKDRNSAQNWKVLHVGAVTASYPNYYQNLTWLNSTAGTNATGTNNSYPWNGTAPTSSVFSVSDFNINYSASQSGVNYIAYCFSGVKGYSDFGKYSGNSSSDGPFIYLGFKPALIVIKRVDGTNGWAMFDSKRDTYNPADAIHFANLNGAESTGEFADFLGNGFKIRSADSNWNGSSEYMYMAWAENPFQANGGLAR